MNNRREKEAEDYYTTYKQKKIEEEAQNELIRYKDCYKILMKYFSQ